MFSPIKSIKLAEEIEEQIRAAILTEKLKAGDKLPSEEELSKIFNASRTTVRQAKRVLEKEGLIHIKQGVTGGTYIREMNDSPVIASITSMLKFKSITLQDITEARLVIEPEVAKLAAMRCTNDDIVRLEQALTELAELVKEKRRSTSTNIKFHRIIAESAKSPVLFFVTQALLNLLTDDLSKRQLDLDQNRLLLKQHTQIFKAIKMQDPEEACLCVRNHVLYVKKIMGSLT
jgi:GntR family transcriptional repressor for pyruvate dehydrogenase complex